MSKILIASLLSFGVLALLSHSASAQVDWSGLPDAPDPIDIANWMTPEREQYFSQGVREGCSRQETLNRYYYGSLAVCNAYKDWYAQESQRIQRDIRNLDRILRCQRAGYRYFY
jgi:hypothetical protein